MKFEIEGQKHNLLLNYDSNILNLFINKSVAIVGSSGILLNKEYGKLIDSFDLVVRLKDLKNMLDLELILDFLMGMPLLVFRIQIDF
jgi:hypothetical protein